MRETWYDYKTALGLPLVDEPAPDRLFDTVEFIAEKAPDGAQYIGSFLYDGVLYEKYAIIVNEIFMNVYVRQK